MHIESSRQPDIFIAVKQFYNFRAGLVLYSEANFILLSNLAFFLCLPLQFLNGEVGKAFKVMKSLPVRQSFWFFILRSAFAVVSAQNKPAATIQALERDIPHPAFSRAAIRKSRRGARLGAASIRRIFAAD